LQAARSVSIKVVPATAEKQESFDEKNLRLNRPQSPHLTIYKPQLTSMLSITHRGTGVALTGYLAIFGLAAIGCPHGVTDIITTLESAQLGVASLTALKFTLAFPFAYHTVNGVRHLFWDMGKFLSVKEVYTTGYAMLFASTIISLILTAL
jgi:succinate dehydrogenase (ubiquinone) cytochrome b560 subunit